MLESLLNKVAGPQALLKRDSDMFFCENCEIFKNTLVVASESLRNAFDQQIFTLQLNNIAPRAILKKIVASLL